MEEFHSFVTLLTRKGRKKVLYLSCMIQRSDLRTIYCHKYSIKPQQFSREVFERTVYSHARWPVKFFGTLSPSYLQADYDFIDSVGRIRRFSEYDQAVREYFDHPMNRSNPLRHNFLFRISTVKMRRLVKELMTRGNLSERKQNTDDL